jgi:hypothetical protein
MWLSAGNGTFYYYGWYNVNFSGWVKVGGSTVYVTKRLTLVEDMLPDSGTTITYEGYWLTNTVTYTVNYMLQNADDDGAGAHGFQLRQAELVADGEGDKAQSGLGDNAQTFYLVQRLEAEALDAKCAQAEWA